MANKAIVDKAISDLTQALQIANEDLFVLEQNGEAKKLKGETLLDFVTLSVVSVTVTTLPAGSSATATYDKSTGTLALGIPQGSKGDTGATGATGPANVLTIGSVTSGKVASATITGEAPNQVLNLVLEKGDKGDTGPEGPRGMQGEQGQQGETGPAGADGKTPVKGTDYFTPTDVNEIAAEAAKKVDISGKLDNTGDGSNVTAAFTAVSTRANIATGEKLSVLFGKIAKWFADLGSLAFKSTVAKSDLASDVQTSLGKADSALQSAPVTSVNSKTGAVSLAKGDVGLGNVDNVKQYSASNPPPYPVTSVNGETGAVTVSVPTIPSTTSLIKGNGSGRLVAAVKGTDYAAPSVSFTVTLSASGWSNKTQPVSDARFLTNGYAYSVAPDSGSFAAYGNAVIYADNVTTAGQMQFHCSETPTGDLIVNILRMEVSA